ncbi:serine hydrolase domain-containing protein [Sinosporangium siamense]|uniref:serine hydrolase domain-containing protein n=1 Tax=Sinosporangium siamense TaxID=1367973 RepID=UPI0023B32D81
MRFRIGSMTKPVMATAILRLVHEGRLRPDDRLSTLLTQVVDLVEQADEITLGRLINHTAGIPDYAEVLMQDPVYFQDSTLYKPADILNTYRKMPNTQEPGEKFSYSNTGYFLLAMIA